MNAKGLCAIVIFVCASLVGIGYTGYAAENAPAAPSSDLEYGFDSTPPSPVGLR